MLPLVVAVTIFKLFPTTKVSASGPFQNLTINVTGAFGAYFITLLAGWFLIDRIDQRIGLDLTPTYTLRAKLKFVDGTGNEINRPQDYDALRSGLKVFIEPPLTETEALPNVSIRIPLVKPDQWPLVGFEAPGFITQPVSLDQLIREKKAKEDTRKHEVVFSEDVVLHLAPQPPAGQVQPGIAMEKHLEPTPGGPPPVTCPASGAASGQEPC